MSCENPKKTLALVGAGYWGKNLARNFNNLGALHTICDESESLLQSFATSEYRSVELELSFQKVLLNPAITKVALAVPAALHYRFAILALRAGKDVFVEKPLCLNIEEGKKLLKEAEERGLILMVGHLLQYHPCIVKLQEMVQRGELGKLYYLSSNRLNLGKIRREENALWSFAPHDISVILSLVGYQSPKEIRCLGQAYLSQNVADTTLTTLSFPDGVRSHIYVSWLNPFKEQKLTVVGSHGMVVFDDSKPWGEKLLFHKDYLKWDQGQNPVPVKRSGTVIEVEEQEPLRNECQHFLDCCNTRKTPKTNGEEGLFSLLVLTAAQRSLEMGGELQSVESQYEIDETQQMQTSYFAHETAIIDEGATIGNKSNIWHFSHVFQKAKIGSQCNIGQNVVVSDGVVLGDRCKVQNNVSLYSGVECEADVFLGPSCVLTNVSNPRSQVNRKSIYEKTLIRKGATIGANATIVCGITIGRYAFVAAGSVVTKDVPDYALIVGNPGRQVGWMSRHGHRLQGVETGQVECPESGLRYALSSNGDFRCLDIDEDEDLPEPLATGHQAYRHFTCKFKP